jgi:hypothetical protein
MTWENSRALTPLKRDFLSSFFHKDQTFYLTGGSALGIFYLEHRLSYDLDFFTDRDVDWHVVHNLTLATAREIAAQCESITASPLFRRYRLRRGEQQEIVDFVVEHVPQIDARKEQFGSVRVDTLHEIAVNKVCTLISRCELKDLVDLFFLARRGFDAVRLLPEAQRKEGGVEPAMIAHLLAHVDLQQPPDYLVEPLDLGDFRRFVADLRRRMAELAFPTR